MGFGVNALVHFYFLLCCLKNSCIVHRSVHHTKYMSNMIADGTGPCVFCQLHSPEALYEGTAYYTALLWMHVLVGKYCFQELRINSKNVKTTLSCASACSALSYCIQEGMVLRVCVYACVCFCLFVSSLLTFAVEIHPSLCGSLFQCSERDV